MLINALLASALATAASPASERALDELSALLQAARSSASVAHSPCPQSMETFVGLSKGLVGTKLGEPDLDEAGTSAAGQKITVHQYLFAPPNADWIGTKVSAGGWTAVRPIGTPFTVVQFHYSPAGVLLAALCHDRA